MNVTFMVGNGFDIAFGIDTSYKAFYEWYLSRPSSSQNIKTMKERIENDKENWSDFELGLGKYTYAFSKDTIQDFEECFKDAQESIVQFLSMKEDETKGKMNYNTEEYRTLRDSIFSFYEELPSAEREQIKEIIDDKITVNFISFNYTQILNKIVKMLVDNKSVVEILQPQLCHTVINPNVINVHGTLDNKPILGVSDSYMIKNSELLNNRFFKTYMLKPECVSALGEAWYSQARQLIQNSNVVCIFGMSLGRSDSVWWEELMDRLINDAKFHIVIFWYDKTPPNSASIIEQLKAKEKIQRDLCEYSAATDAMIVELRKRVHVVFNTKRMFNFTSTQQTQADLALV